MRRRVNGLNPTLWWHVGRSNVLPRLAAIPCHLNEAIVGTGPDDPWSQRRFLDGVQNRVVLLTGDVPRDRTTRHLLPLRTESGEIGADLLPRHTLVRRLVNELRTVVDRARVVRRHLDRNGALEAIGELRWVHTVQIREADVVLLLLARDLVVPTETTFAVGVNDRRVTRLRNGGSGLTTTDRLPVALMSTLRASARWVTWHSNRAVVLLARVEPVWELVVNIDLV